MAQKISQNVQINMAIPEHVHCVICGKPIKFGETTCSEECKQRYQKISKNRRIWMYLMWGLILIMIVVLLVVPQIQF